MNKTAIIIPSRLDAQRLPNKPLKLIKNKEMILHVYEAAIKSNNGNVYVATPDQKLFDLIKNIGGKVVKTSNDHLTGTDRVFEVFQKSLNSEPDIVVNLQGDMPNISPKAINKLIEYMKKNKCDIATLGSDLKYPKDLSNPNIVKVAVNEKLTEEKFVESADFFRTNKSSIINLYHHIGIYAFTKEALIRYVELQRSKLEIERKLEQLRALENNMTIHVGYVKASPLSIDTEEDLIKVKELMERNEKN